MEYIQEITLDVNPNSSFVTVTAKQDDVNSRKLLIHFTKNGEKYEINSDRVWLRVRKPDGHVVLKEGTINKSKGTVEVNLTPQILAVPGRAYADIIEFNDSSNTSDTLSTASFIIIIQAQPSSPVFSSDDFLALKEFVDHGMSIIDTSTNLNSAGTWLDKSGTLYWGFSKEPVGESVIARLAAVEALAESSAQTAAESAATAETAQSAAEEAQAQLASTAADVGELKSANELVQQTIGLKELPFNKDGFVRWRDGVLISGDDTKNTGFVETAGYNKIQISAQLGTVGALIAYYDSNKSFLQSISVEGRGSARPVTGIYDIPSQAAYLIVSNYNYLDNHARLIINDKVGDKISIIESDIAGIKTLKGKKIMFFGDSITAMSECYRSNLISYTEMTETYCLAISNARLCNLANTVMDGNPIYPSTNNTVPNQVQKVINHPENYTTIPDIILVAAGTNDQPNVFTFDETQFIDNDNYINIDNCDLKTCSGAMRWIYEKLMTLYPTAQVFFVTPIQASQGDQTYSRTYSGTKNKRNAIIANAERMSVCYIDAFNKSGIYGRYETVQQNGKYLADGLHPNANGAVVLAKCIENGILENINH